MSDEEHVYFDVRSRML